PGESVTVKIDQPTRSHGHCKSQVLNGLSELGMGAYKNPIASLLLNAMIREDLHRVPPGLKASCTWSYVRKLGLPITVEAVCAAFSVNKKDIWRGMQRIKKSHPHAAFVESGSYELDRYLPKLCSEYPQLAPRLERDTRVILYFAKRAFLDQGRHQASICGAAFCIAYQAKGRIRASPHLRTFLTRTLTVRKKILDARFHELEGLLLKCAAQFPFFAALDTTACTADATTQSSPHTQLYRMLPELLHVLGTELTATRTASLPVYSGDAVASTGLKIQAQLVPPSFARSARKTHDLTHRLIRAQVHVAKFHRGEVDCAGLQSDED
ncbi:hypothetical protein HKX48_003309, partial [Thoreauomyces humboldtii]